MGGSLAADAARLNDLTIEVINEQIKQKRGGVIRDTVEGYELVRAVLVVWHETDILDQINLEPVPIRNQFLRLVKALLPEGKEATFDNLGEAMIGIIATKPVARKFGSLRSGSTVTYKRFWVASFLHQQNWATLQARG